jgi:hypothetical protein
VIACSIRGDVKNILLPPPEARLWFAASSPLSDRSGARVLCLALWFALLHLSSCMFISSDNADRFVKLASTGGCTVSTMVLSATRGLVLFRVIREGIGLTQRLSATGTVRLQAIRMLTLEPERLKNQLATTRKRLPAMEGFSRETLKRLAISVCQRRSFLPSSIELA